MELEFTHGEIKSQLMINDSGFLTCLETIGEDP